MGGSPARCLVVAAHCALALGACDAPLDGGFRIEPMTFPGARTALAERTTRVELELRPEWGRRVARELELAPEHLLDADERIESRVITPGFESLVTEGACRGSLSLDLLGPDVQFDDQTRFEDQDGRRISCHEFVTAIEAFVVLGQEPQITAERRPPAVPQAPDDPVFLADELRIDDEDDDSDQRPEIFVNAGAANLASCDELISAPGDCVGAVRVLGLIVAIGNDATQIERADPEPRLQVRFDAIVESVDPTRRELRLSTGAVLRLVQGSEIEWNDAATGDVFRSLDDVEDALALRRLVEAHGTAAVVSTDPLVLWVNEVELEIERDLSADAFRPVVEIEGQVLDADPDDGFVSMPFDTRLRITEVSELEGDFHALSELGNAMISGRTVRADALVFVEEIQHPVLVTRGDRVTFLGDGPE